MEYRHLGRSGLKVSTITIGTMLFGQPASAAVGSTGARDVKRQIDLCLDAGVNLIDTADVYAGGRSEELIGSALGKKRADVLIATKVRYRMGDGPNMAGLSRKHVIQGCEASLRRLGVEAIDLYQIHRADAATPMEETLAALDHLVHHGKVRYIGASSMYAWQLMKMLSISERRGWARFVSMQNHYNLLYREEEREMIPLCRDQGLGILPWSPLARGMLTGKRRRGEHTTTARDAGDAVLADQLYDHPGDWDVVDATVRVAKRHGMPPARIALAWLLSRPGVTAPIIGATKLEHLDDAVASLEVRLSPEDIAELEAPYQPHGVRGWHDGASGPAPIR